LLAPTPGFSGLALCAASPHSLRHFAASAQEGIKDLSVQEILLSGHLFDSSHYLHAAASDINRVYESNPLSGFQI
jgi:hypothetical protein